jgi:hypothetical protein
MLWKCAMASNGQPGHARSATHYVFFVSKSGIPLGRCQQDSQAGLLLDYVVGIGREVNGLINVMTEHGIQASSWSGWHDALSAVQGDAEQRVLADSVHKRPSSTSTLTPEAGSRTAAGTHVLGTGAWFWVPAVKSTSCNPGCCPQSCEIYRR